VDKVIGPVLESLGKNGEQWVKMSIALMRNVLANNGDNIPTCLRQRITCTQACLSANAQTEYQINEKQAKTDYLDQYETVNLEEVLNDENLFYEYLDAPDAEEVTRLIQNYKCNKITGFSDVFSFRHFVDVIWYGSEPFTNLIFFTYTT